MRLAGVVYWLSVQFGAMLNEEDGDMSAWVFGLSIVGWLVLCLVIHLKSYQRGVDYGIEIGTARAERVFKRLMDDHMKALSAAPKEDAGGAEGPVKVEERHGPYRISEKVGEWFDGCEIDGIHVLCKDCGSVKDGRCRRYNVPVNIKGEPAYREATS